MTRWPQVDQKLLNPLWMTVKLKYQASSLTDIRPFLRNLPSSGFNTHRRAEMCPRVSSAVRCIEKGFPQDHLYISKVLTSNPSSKYWALSGGERRVVRPLSVISNAALCLRFSPRDGELAYCGRSHLSKLWAAFWKEQFPLKNGLLMPRNTRSSVRSFHWFSWTGIFISVTL